ncbi:hypothetical protein [Fimbriiglobus ruber]|uniref:Uncharacterized protein n=1 Tax=Fimbriiglobus ruber TaxID=1908690 RepID=A0A225DTV3_9BACT|nr:hypothetical protein [Fimbriiglobus ruber]OWK43034.1 hypothetical protein FRUB_02633 [Fimbriiglobus ruber]
MWATRAAAVFVLGVAIAFGGDRAPDEAAEADRACAAELARWQLSSADSLLDRPAAPAQKWTNPSAGRVYGHTYVWLDRGRPAAVGCLYRYFDPYQSLNGELVALTGSQLVAKKDDKVIWEPQTKWEWHPLPGAATPAAGGPQRLIQMRAIADECKVELLDKRNTIKGDSQTPRLLTTPIYRYDFAKSKPLDGALFAYVIGTDPELLLLLECDTSAAAPEWRFGVGRLNRDHVKLRRKGGTAWEGPAIVGGYENEPTEAYHFFPLALREGAKK